METVKYFGEKVIETAKNYKEYPKQIGSAFRKDPWFCAVILASYVIIATTITTVSGAFIQFSGIFLNEKDQSFELKFAKIGLFNSAVNEKWTTHSYSACMERAFTDEQRSVCNARVSVGTIMLFSLFATFIASILLTIMVTRTLYEHRVAQAKMIVISIFAFCGILIVYIGIANLVAMSVGSGVIYRILKSDPKIKDASYGVGFVFSIVNWILYVAMIPAVYLMVSFDGYIQTLPRLSRQQKLASQLPPARQQAYY
jgi:hypothetical protein